MTFEEWQEQVDAVIRDRLGVSDIDDDPPFGFVPSDEYRAYFDSGCSVEEAGDEIAGMLIKNCWEY